MIEIADTKIHMPQILAVATDLIGAGSITASTTFIHILRYN